MTEQNAVQQVEEQEITAQSEAGTNTPSEQQLSVPTQMGQTNSEKPIPAQYNMQKMQEILDMMSSMHSAMESMMKEMYPDSAMGSDENQQNMSKGDTMVNESESKIKSLAEAQEMLSEASEEITKYREEKTQLSSKLAALEAEIADLKTYKEKYEKVELKSKEKLIDEIVSKKFASKKISKEEKDETVSRYMIWSIKQLNDEVKVLSAADVTAERDTEVTNSQQETNAAEEVVNRLSAIGITDPEAVAEAKKMFSGRKPTEQVIE